LADRHGSTWKAMATVGSVTRQIAALEISSKQNGATKQSRSLHQKTTSQTNVSKLLTKFAAPHPFPDTKVKAASVRTLPPRPANPTAKQPQPAPASKAKFSSGRELDIGKYDGGFEIENEKRGEAVDGEAARDLALDSSVSRLVCPPPSSAQLLTRPLKNTPHPRMAPYRL
jgi:aurora kinase